MLRSFRTLSFGVLGLMVAALFLAMPAAAAPVDDGAYAVTVDLAGAELAVFTAASVEDRTVAAREDHGLDEERPAAAALGPIYALSLQTAGQSLRRYHMLC